MKMLLFALVLLLPGAFAIKAQVKPRSAPAVIPSGVPVKSGSTPTQILVKSAVDPGKVEGRTYTNYGFGFDIVLPDDWYMGGPDFDRIVKQSGYDLSLKAPDSIALADRAAVNRSVKKVSLLLTAFRETQGARHDAILRISAESLTATPQIKDAVDYFDAIRATYKAITLPKDFQYSETQAEQLGTVQFAYIDTSVKEGKKRLYATVRRGYAILFTLSYLADDDLAIMRRILEEGNFALKQR